MADNKSMDDRDKIAERLLAWQAVKKKTGAEICRSIGAPENSWIQWTGPNYERIIPIDFASKLCLNYELTLEWIYRGLPIARVPDDIRDSVLNKPAPKRRRAAGK